MEVNRTFRCVNLDVSQGNWHVYRVSTATTNGTKANYTTLLIWVFLITRFLYQPYSESQSAGTFCSPLNLGRRVPSLYRVVGTKIRA